MYIRFTRNGDYDLASSLVSIDGDDRIDRAAEWYSLQSFSGGNISYFLVAPSSNYQFQIRTAGNVAANAATDGLLINFRGHQGSIDLDGGYMADRLVGGEAGDYLRGDSGNDVLRGGGGGDRLVGGTGADLLFGDAGADLFTFASRDDFATGDGGVDRISGFSGAAGDGDEIDLTALAGPFGRIAVIERGPFRGSGDVEVRILDRDDRSVVLVDWDGDKLADARFIVRGDTPTAADFTMPPEQAPLKAFATAESVPSDVFHAPPFHAGTSPVAETLFQF